MIDKDLTVPIKLQADYALDERLAEDYPKKGAILEDIAKREAGYNGEKNLCYHLNFLPKEDFRILFDLQLKINDKEFQIDVLLISLYFALIIEVKNFAGTLVFDSKFNQFIRTINNKEEGYPNPLTQAKKHQLLLDSWLKKNKFPLPVDYLVAISYPSTILRSTEAKKIPIHDKVLHAENIPLKIHELQKRYKEPILTPRSLKKLSETIIRSHTLVRPEILQTFSIPPEDIQKGVCCPQCKGFAMLRKYRRWHCPHCSFISKDAHVQALKDFYLLISPTITNLQCREFLHLSDRKTAQFLLTSLNLSYSYIGRKRVYHFHDLFLR